MNNIKRVFLVVILFLLISSSIWIARFHIPGDRFIIGKTLNDTIVITGLISWLILNISMVFLAKWCLKRRSQSLTWRMQFFAVCLIFLTYFISSFLYSLLMIIMLPVALLTFGVALLVNAFAWLKPGDRVRKTIIICAYILIATSVLTGIAFLNAMSNM